LLALKPGATVSVPAAPTGLGATPACGAVVLNWTASCGAAGYKVKRSATSGTGYALIGTAAGTTYTDSPGLGTTGYYVVSATNSAGESANCAQASALPLSPPSVGSVSPASQTVAVGSAATFTVPAPGGTGPFHYQWRKNSSTPVGTDSPSYAIHPVTGADAGTYDCVVSGACTPSATAAAGTLAVSATPPPPELPGSAITVTGGLASFTFATVSGFKYRLAYMNALTDTSWLPVLRVTPPDSAGWVLATSTSMILSDTNTVGELKRFYRLQAAAP
jgi:cellulose 1,4-beta-cellobiosidase